MRNILFVPSVADTEWVQDILPGSSPAELPVAGRRIVDYATERAQRFGVILTEILDWHFKEDIARHFSEVTRTGFPVFYHRGEGELPRGLNDLSKQSSPLTWNILDGLVVIWGLYIGFHEPEEVTLAEMPDDECENTPMGMYRRKNGRWMRILPKGYPIRDVKEWHAINMLFFKNGGKFTFPGYSAENGVNLGRNVVMEHGTEVKSPVIMQDNTWCARNVLLDGEVIVGQGSFIDEGARLRRTIVCDNTYIGRGVELEDKIVAGGRVVDAKSGAWTDLGDQGLAHSIGGVGILGWLKSLWHFLLGTSIRGRGR